jgi:hypothetical protein
MDRGERALSIVDNVLRAVLRLLDSRQRRREGAGWVATQCVLQSAHPTPEVSA